MNTKCDISRLDELSNKIEIFDVGKEIFASKPIVKEEHIRKFTFNTNNTKKEIKAPSISLPYLNPVLMERAEGLFYLFVQMGFEGVRGALSYHSYLSHIEGEESQYELVVVSHKSPLAAPILVNMSVVR